MERFFKIYLDSIVFSIQQFGGASTYWKELLLNFRKQKNISLIIQANNTHDLNADAQEVFDGLDRNHVEVIKETKLPVGILRYLPLTKRLPAKALYHNSYYRTCLQKNVVNIFTIHDFTHKRGLASKFPRKLVHIALTSLGLNNADGIICISESTKKDLLHFYPKIDPEKITVIYHGIGDRFKPLEHKKEILFRDTLNLSDKFVMFVGKRGGYKKFDIMPPAFANRLDVKLVMVGGGPLTEQEHQNLEANMPGRYFKFDGINNEELNLLYNYAHCMVYPSIYEGFGIPLLEAMRAGCPVITNRLSSLGEIAGDAALFISDISSDAIEEQLDKLDNRTLRTQLIEKGYARGQEFSWDKCYNETYNFYKKIYFKKFGST